jgi:hypothetical protein
VIKIDILEIISQKTDMSLSNSASSKVIRTIRFYFPLIILASLLSCNFPESLQSTPQPAPLVPAGEQIIPEAQISFLVEIPADTPDGEPILLSVLDEVTGLALNAKRYPMDQLDETHYQITLPFRLGSVIKYRYSRGGDILAEEHTTDGRSVRYRILHARDSLEVNDLVARWNDTIFNGPTGRITGIIMNDNSPTAGLLVTAGGTQVYTTQDGRFLIEGLPTGTHNLVVYSLDGNYEIFQQGAKVAEGSNTPAEIQVKTRPTVEITFLVKAPDDTVPIVPLRLAGNLYQMGNTFSDLAGGVNTLATRMPTLTPLSVENTYGTILELPIGSDIRYKYTLGDGFWNAERGVDGSFAIRQLIVPDTPMVIEDTIETWYIGEPREITFDLIVPENTHSQDQIFIQFNPYGWTEPIPMWHLGGQRWAYILFSPLDLIDQLGYRYCRAGQCGHADDARTPGEFTSGQIIQTSPNRLGVPDQVEQWAWLEDQLPETTVTDTKVPKRGPTFIAGIELQEYYHPSLDPLFDSALENIVNDGANWIVLSPSWSYSRLTPPVLEPISGQDSLWRDTIEMINKSQKSDLNIALRPVPKFNTATSEWWASAPRDFSWWVSWFDNYRAFVLHHAELAADSGAESLILGGEWIAPALPGGTLADGSLSGVPVDANERFQNLIAEARERFDGTIAWSIAHPDDFGILPSFLNHVDQLVVDWSAPLASSETYTNADLKAEAKRIVTSDIYGLWLTWKPETSNKSIVISLAYPSANGILTGCLPDPLLECLPPRMLNYPAPDYPLIELDLKSQAQAYDAVLTAINSQDWIGGVISNGYYTPTILHDKSTSIHGKPAEGVLRSWYTRFLRE